MMGSKTLRLLPLATTAAVLSACTIGPRTPIHVATSEPSRGESHASSKQQKEDDFRLPKAERVTDKGSRSQAQIQHQNEDAPAHLTRVGQAELTIGARPPWAKLEGLAEQSGQEPNAVPLRWRLKKSIWVGQGYLHQADFTPDENSVVTLSHQTGEVYHYDLGGKLLRKIALPAFKEFDDAAFSTMPEISERAQLLVVRPSGTSVLDLESGKFDFLDDVPAGNEIAHSGRPGLYGLSFRKTEPQSGLLLLQWINGDVVAQLTCHDRPDSWALSADGRTLAVGYYPSNNVEVIDLEKKKVVATLPLPKWGGPVAISPDGSLLAMGGEKLQVVRLSDLKVVGEDTNYDNNIDTVRFTPQGDLLLASAYDGKARSYALVSDLTTLSKLPVPQKLAHGGSANVYALGLTADGRHLVTSSGDKTLKIWQR